MPRQMHYSQELLARLRGNDPDLTSVDLADKDLGDEGARALAEALKHNSTLEELDLGGNSIGDEGAMALADALRHNSTLQKLGLFGNNIGAEGATALAEGLRHNSILEELDLRHNSTLQKLDLGGNIIGNEGAKALAKALKHNSTLQILYLHVNSIGPEGAWALAESLGHNSTLQELGLQCNSIGDEGARALTEAFMYNSTLKELDLHGNSIGDEGARALAEALRHNSTLQKLGLQCNEISLDTEGEVEAALSDPDRGRGPAPPALSSHSIHLDAHDQAAAQQAPGFGKFLFRPMKAALTGLNRGRRQPPSSLRQILFQDIEVQGSPLGAGSFKTVHRGLLDGRHEVVVLTLRRGACDTEAAVFERLGRHPRLTRLLGTSADPEGRSVLVTEFATLGSLNRVLQSLDIEPSNAVLLQCALQVCEGMEQVIESELIHRDLALRNILVFEFDAQNPREVRVKVTDYGLTRKGQLPIRWMPPEALERRRWSEKSDVWAFGVLMWELWSAAEIPFAFEGNDKDVARRVCKGERLPRPSRCPESVYEVMQKCWARTAQGRPSFRDLRNDLLELYGTAITDAREDDGGTCVICLDAPPEVALVPCGHQCVCQEHAQMVTRCPVCRAPVRERLRVFQ